MRRTLVVMLALAAFGTGLQAQTPAPRVEIADRIVAVVGDSIVLRSEVDLEIQQLKQANQLQDSAGTFKKIVDRRVGELVLLQAATRDTSLHVSDETVSAETQKEIDARKQSFGSEAAFQTALLQAGITLDELRRNMTQEIYSRMLLKDFVGKMSKDRHAPPVTDNDIRRYFEENKASFGARPATITFSQVVLTPHASDTARATARKKAEEALQKLRAGGDFETLAKEYSEDPSTREKGGDLGWFRSGAMVREFDQVVFALQPGQISNIVESQFGFHIIKLEKVRGAERQARHILIIPTTTPEDAERTRALGTEIAAKMKAGANVDSLAKTVGDPNEQIHVGPFARNNLPEPYKTELANAVAGTVVGPLELPGATGVPKFAIVKILETRPAGEYSLDDPDFRNDLKQTLAQNTLVDELIRDLKKRTLVEYRLEP